MIENENSDDELELEMPMITREDNALVAPIISITGVEKKNSLITEIEKNMNIAKKFNANEIAEQKQPIIEVSELETVHSIDRPLQIANQCMSTAVRPESAEQILPLKRKHRASSHYVESQIAG